MSLFVTESELGALLLGFGKGRSNGFENDICSRYVALNLVRKGLVKRNPTRRGTMMSITALGRDVLKEFGEGRK
jgi:hypothetical protein